MVRARHRLARHVAEDPIAAAIRASEAHTTGKILVTLAHHRGADVMAAALAAFVKLEMHRADHRNNVLFYVVPERREFAVVGDAAVHDALGQDFWDDLVRAMSERIRSEDLTRGIVFGIERVGGELTARFPKA
jgi:uncharacterized membrane protein